MYFDDARCVNTSRNPKQKSVKLSKKAIMLEIIRKQGGAPPFSRITSPALAASSPSLAKYRENIANLKKEVGI